jgi:hypothetical protein
MVDLVLFVLNIGDFTKSSFALLHVGSNINRTESSPEHLPRLSSWTRPAGRITSIRLRKSNFQNGVKPRCNRPCSPICRR